MSWLFSQALVEEYLGGGYSAGAQSAQSSGSPIQQAYCAQDKMTAFSHLSQSGMMFKPLTATHGEALLMSYLAAFHALTFQQQERMQRESPDKPLECGDTWPGLLEKSSPGQYSLKIAPCWPTEGLKQSFQTWPRWGLMRDGVCLGQKPLALNTNAIACGSWGTPTTSQDFKPVRPLAPSEANGTHGKILVGSIGKEHPHLIGRYLKPLVTEYLMGWPIGWTDLKPLAMAKCQQSQQQHGES